MLINALKRLCTICSEPQPDNGEAYRCFRSLYLRSAVSLVLSINIPFFTSFFINTVRATGQINNIN